MRCALCGRPPLFLPFSCFRLPSRLAPSELLHALTVSQPSLSLSFVVASVGRRAGDGRRRSPQSSFLPSFLPYSIVRGLGAFAALDAHCNAVDYSRVAQPASQPASLSLSCDRRRNSREREERRSCKRAVFSPLYRPVVLPHRKREKEREGGGGAGEGDDDEKEN